MPGPATMNFNLVAGVTVGLAAAVLHFALPDAAFAQKKYAPEATNTEIKISNISPHSGSASTYSAIAKAQTAYFRMINDHGGINTRMSNYISYDDGYSPPKTIEQTRRRVENDEILFLLSNLGIPGNAAIHKYMNQKKVPQLFVTSGVDKWADPMRFTKDQWDLFGPVLSDKHRAT